MKKLSYYVIVFFGILCLNTHSFANQSTNQLLQEANRGNPKAQFAIGDLYYTGKLGPKNDRKAIEYYQKAANQGYAEAQYALGDMYYRGYGVTKNDTKAAEWFEKASDVGDAGGQMALASIYLSGKDVPKDIEKSKYYLQKACLNKTPQGCDLLNTLNKQR